MSAGVGRKHGAGALTRALSRISSTEVPDKTRREPPSRIQIQYPAPSVDGGRYAAKRCLGDTVTVSADIFRDGHDKLRAVVRFRGPGDKEWEEAPVRFDLPLSDEAAADCRVASAMVQRMEREIAGAPGKLTASKEERR